MGFRRSQSSDYSKVSFEGRFSIQKSLLFLETETKKKIKDLTGRENHISYIIKGARGDSAEVMARRDGLGVKAASVRIATSL